MATPTQPRPPIARDVDARHAKPEAKPYKRRLAVEGHDTKGAYLLVTPEGGKYWRLKYRVAGREKLLALGAYPSTSLASACLQCAAARADHASGVDPGKRRRDAKTEKDRSVRNTFGAIADEWFSKRVGKWSPAHARAVRRRLDTDLKALASKPIADIGADDVLAVLRGIEERGAYEIASKARVVVGQVFRYAIGSPGKRVKSDPTRDLRGQMEVREQRHYNRLREEDLPEFLVKLDAYDGTTVTKLALRLLVLTFVRTAELRGARWSEVNFDKAEWRIPAERMKGRCEHIVPLSAQAVETLTELQAITGDGELLFPNEVKGDAAPMSENTILFALYRMGYRGRATGHGFRATASTILHEQNWSSNVIERQLAHKDPNEIRAAYNHSGLLPERRKMMQAWADFLDAKKAEGEAGEGQGKVVNIARKRA